MNKGVIAAIAASVMLMPTMVFAHTGSGSGFEAGLSHPVLGLDHLLAMVLVGVLAAQTGKKAMWQVPATFVAVMVVGGVLGMNAIEVPWVELGIVGSVVALGIVVAIGWRLPVQIGMAAVAFFALFHGHAHGTEMPTLAEPAMYALGFIIGSASLHVVGLMLVQLCGRFRHGQHLCRLAGAVSSLIGMQMLLS